MLQDQLHGRGLDQRSRLGGASPRGQSGPTAEPAPADRVLAGRKDGGGGSARAASQSLGPASGDRGCQRPARDRARAPARDREAAQAAVNTSRLTDGASADWLPGAQEVQVLHVQCAQDGLAGRAGPAVQSFEKLASRDEPISVEQFHRGSWPEQVPVLVPEDDLKSHVVWLAEFENRFASPCVHDACGEYITELQVGSHAIRGWRRPTAFRGWEEDNTRGDHPRHRRGFSQFRVPELSGGRRGWVG